MAAQGVASTIFDVVFAPPAPATEDGRRLLLRESDNWLGRFGEAARLDLEPGRAYPFTIRSRADRVWIILSGEVRVVMHDPREVSPSRGTSHVGRLDHRPHALVLIPFGVACAPRASGGPAMLLELASHESALENDARVIAADDPSIGFDWSSLGG
jgi:dTDP-4-dehydrorhamnose 3,5-epimerase